MERSPIPFSRPYIGHEERAAVDEVLRSGWLTTGRESLAFEEEFASYVGARHAVAVSSATIGVALVLAALDIGPGDEVICPVWSFSSPAMEVYHRGARPVFVDVDPITLNPDPKAVKKAIREKTKAILTVHFAGLPCDMSAMQALAREHGLYLIEDAAHALPAAVDGNRVGGLDSSAAVFSFYANKTITTAEGGMITTQDDLLAARLKKLRLHGIDRDVFDRYRAVGKSWAYDIVDGGYKANLPDVLAAMGRVQLGRCSCLWEMRTRIAVRYLNQLQSLHLGLPVVDCEKSHAWHLFVIRVPHGLRESLTVHLAEDGIGTSVHFIPMHFLKFWKTRYLLSRFDFPEATSAFSEVLSLPIFPGMTDLEVTRVVDSIKNWRESVGNRIAA